MDISTDIHATARDWFIAKTVNGSVPQQVHGGQLDGLLHYSVFVDETELWLTMDGCFTPPKNEQTTEAR